MCNKEWSRAKSREFIFEILKGKKSVTEIAAEKGITKFELIRNGFYSLSRYQNLEEQLMRWKNG